MADIRTWLDGLGLERYADVFEANDIDLDVLPHLTEAQLDDLGIEAERYHEYEDRELYGSLASSTFFDRETFGADHLAVGSLGAASTLKGAPLSEYARKDLIRLMGSPKHFLQVVPKGEREDLLKARDIVQQYL